MIDPKMLELSVYERQRHPLRPLATDPAKAVAALEWVVAEMEQRYRRMSALSVRKHRGLQRPRAPGSRIRGGPGIPEPDEERHRRRRAEFADLMLVAGKEIDSAVQTVHGVSASI